MRYLLALPFLGFVGLVAACATSDSPSLANYDTSCTAATDCAAVVVGQLGCCNCPDGAINKTDLARYTADQQAESHNRGVCAVACIACPAVTLACTNGTCEVAKPDAGPTACGTTTCTPGEICVKSQVEGGVQILPNDAGMCPEGDQNNGTSCEPAPTFRCALLPPQCASNNSCLCSGDLCASGFTCQSATANELSCALLAP